MSQEHQLLLHGYSGLKDAYQLVLKTAENSNTIAEYYMEALARFSKKKVQKILEIGPLDEESFQIFFRKSGYDVTSITLDMRISAVAGEQDGDHYIIGKDFNFPKLKQKFDAVVVTHGCFGKFISLDKSSEFLTRIFDCLLPSGLLIFEFWHLPGVESAVTDKKGHKDWEKIESAKEGSIMRYTISKLHLDSSILSIDAHYIIEKNNEIQKFNESHAWRLYTQSEIELLLTKENFQFCKAFKFSTFEDPEFSTFRLLGISEKL